MKLFKPKPKKVLIPRDQFNIQKIIELVINKQVTELSPLVFLELIRQLDERVKKLESKMIGNIRGKDLPKSYSRKEERKRDIMNQNY